LAYQRFRDANVHAADSRTSARPGPATAGEPVALVIFDLGGNRYGLPAASVQEVCQAVTISPLPRAPSAIEGVLDVRGTMVPVFDVRGRFGLAPRAAGPDDHIIIASAGERSVALRVDRALDLVRVAPDQIQAAEQFSSNLRHVVGVARLADGLVVIHDLAAFLSQAEADQLAAALRDAAPP
jgi:purine-binding chemotaxis protein CheW